MKRKDEAKWVKFIEVLGRTHALLVESYYKAHGIETQLIQEAYYEFKLSAEMGLVQILVPNTQLKQAQKLYDQSGWDFDIREDDEDDE